MRLGASIMFASNHFTKNLVLPLLLMPILVSLMKTVKLKVKFVSQKEDYFAIRRIRLTQFTNIFIENSVL